MKATRVVVAGIMTMIVAASGCATHAGTGAAAGGLTGAGIGAGLGKLAGNTTGGAIIGGMIGTATGAIIGDQLDRDQLAEERRVAAIQQAVHTPPPPPRMTLYDVIEMKRQGVSDAIVIQQIYATGSVFYLQAGDITELSRHGVSDAVIQAMMDTARRPPVVRRHVIVEREPIYIYEPPPRFSVGIGYHFGPRCYRPHRCW